MDSPSMIIFNLPKIELPKEKRKELMNCCAMAMIVTFAVFPLLANAYRSIFGVDLEHALLQQMLCVVVFSTYFSVRAYNLAFNSNNQKYLGDKRNKGYNLWIRVGLYPSCRYFFQLVGGMTIFGFQEVGNTDVNTTVLPMIVAMASTYDAYHMGYFLSHNLTCERKENIV